MKLLQWVFVVLVVFAAQGRLAAQADSIEVFIIESFVSPENPGVLQLTFNTSVPCKSKVLIANKYLIPVADTITDTHKKDIDISKYYFDSTNSTFKAILTDSTGHTNESDIFEINLPVEDQGQPVESKSASWTSCFTGGITYLIPNITMNLRGENSKLVNYWGLSKEFPLLCHYQGGYNFPKSFLSAEYSYVFKFEHKNFIRLGYKFLYETGFGEYVVLGLDGFSDFRGFNGVSPEITWGIIPVRDVFTLYIRYRYNTDFRSPRTEFSEVSLGLYSWFFSAHL